MKRIIFFLSFSILLVSSLSSQTLSKIWTSGEGLKTPESALYDASMNCIFVSNIDGKPSEKDGNGFIAILNADGKIKNLHWITGLNAPKGQAISKGNLYVADIDELVEINIKESKIINRYKVENAKFLNDVTASDDGTIYFSDMQDQKIYSFANGKVSLWLDDKILENVNGLWAEKNKLFIGNARILEADMKTKAIKTLVENCNGIDGLERLPDGNFIYSNWEGRIYITKGSESIKLIDTAGKQNTADIDFVPEKNLVLVPTFSGNSVEAYTLRP